MGKNQFKELEKRTVLKCEACGGFHSEKDSEIVLIKIVKGKNCELDQTKLLNHINPTPVQTISKTEQPIVTPTEESAAAARQEARRRKSIVPPGLRSVFSQPPGTEQ